ncbi:hypothetical protein [Bacillus salipaludis]|uniref:hypothetical protein n=1 Tax=Bacillus salipaludis TaxID=2547811 RepID=UPI002E1E299F|nr:hypothetical protein [Bacillus salipaludis]
MKFNKGFLYLLVISIILPFFNPYIAAKAETDLTTTEKYYIGDEYISGHTSVENAKIKVISKYMNGIDYISGAKANKNGDFKLVYNPYNPIAGTDVQLGVYNEENTLVDTEIVTIRSDRHFPVSPINTETENIIFSGNSFSSVDLVRNGQVIATTSQRSMKAPKLNPGDFLTFNFKLSTGDVVRVKKTVFLSGKDILIYPMSNFSGRTKGKVSIPNAHLLYYIDDLMYGSVEFRADANGNFNQTIKAGGIVPYFYVCVFEPEFDNYIGKGEPEYIEQPVKINPITNLSTEISGRATPNQVIEVTDIDTNTLIGVTNSDDYGYYKLGVTNLVADDLISVKAYSTENPEKFVSSKTDVQKVYINEIDDASNVISGVSSFGTSVSVAVTPPTTKPLFKTMSLTATALNTKNFGPYPITEGRAFSLKTGRIASGSKVSLTFMKNGEKTTLPAKIVNHILTPAMLKKDVAVINKKGKKDTVTFKNIKPGSTVRAYTKNTGGSLIKSLKSTSTSAVLTITQLGKVKGTVYVTITNPGLKESDRVAVSYLGEQSDSISKHYVKVTNNKRKKDIVSISKVTKSDIIKVYSSKNKLLASKEVKKGTSTSFSFKQLGARAGFIYVTITKKGMLASPKTKVSFKKEK